MNLAGDQIKDTYGALLNIGASGATSTLQPVTDGFGNTLPFEVSTTTFNFTGTVTGGPIGPTGAAGTSGTSGTSGINGTSGTSGIDGTSGTSGISGSSGTSGTSGINGATGPAGPTGAAAPGSSSPITVEQTNSLVSTAIGATATSGGSIAIGSTASATGLDTIVFGQNSIACGAGSIVIGKNSCQSLPDGQSVVIGNCAWTHPSLDYGGHVVVGLCARAGYAGPNVTIGYRAVGNTDSVAILNAGVGGASVAIGNASNTAGDFSVAIGRAAYAGAESIAIGACTNNQPGACSVAIGRESLSSSANSILMGYTSRIFCGATGAIVLGNSSVGGTGACDSVVLGNSSCTIREGSIVIGKSAFSETPDTIILGNSSVVNKNISSAAQSNAILIGNNSTSFDGENITIGSSSSNCGSDDGVNRTNIVIGNRSAAYRSLGYGIVLGNQAIICGYGVVIGGISCATGSGGGIAIGAATEAGDKSIHVGNEGSTTGSCSTTIGNNSTSTSNCSNILGANNTASNTGATVIGFGLTSEKNNTVHVDNLISYGQAASKAHSVGTTGGTVTLNWDNSNAQFVTLDSSISSLTKSNPIDGGVYTVFVTQGGTGSYTVAWGSDVKWAGGTGPVLSTAVGATDAVTLIYYAGITGYYGNANLNFA